MRYAKKDAPTRKLFLLENCLIIFVLFLKLSYLNKQSLYVLLLKRIYFVPFISAFITFFPGG